MDLSALEPFLREQGPLLGTFIVAFVAGFIPLINVEIFLVGMIALLNLTDMLWLIALVAAVGQILAKIILYFASAGVLKVSKGKRFTPAKIEKLSAKILQGGWKGDAVILSSAFVGIPPIYLTALVAGLARYPLVKFVVMGLCGRFARFSIVVVFPEYFQKLRDLF
jgi:membrane protein YqaA with SNARE-associated domain